MHPIVSAGLEAASLEDFSGTAAARITPAKLFHEIDIARWLLDEGIESISLNPDTVVETWMFLAGTKI